MEDALEPYLNGFALGILFFLFIGGIYLVIYIHDIPYNIAKKRKHPHLEAIHMAGWVSLILMHSIWPIIWIWAYLFTPKANHYDDSGLTEQEKEDLEHKDKIVRIKKLSADIEILKKEVHTIEEKLGLTEK
ncbi:MAG: hypothetical protein BM564_12325 [Bacteroidetes bacterium MedPE-SWsnd-G2]|nr:MAG: hypothetical protein BM564_12325 [Bacteroidetes bacterium MedPE-SWsnd-G2]